MTINIDKEVELAFTFDQDEYVEKVILAAMDFIDCPYEAEINVLFTDNAGIQEMNKEYREIDRPTDVLSFPMFEYDENGEIIEEFADFNKKGELLLGDIVISLEHAEKQAQEYGHSYMREVGFLTVHSMLHLFGYDHMNEEDEKEMFSYQEEILNEMGLGR